jgi:hypothetical protein
MPFILEKLPLPFDEPFFSAESTVGVMDDQDSHGLSHGSQWSRTALPEANDEPIQ